MRSLREAERAEDTTVHTSPEPLTSGLEPAHPRPWPAEPISVQAAARALSASDAAQVVPLPPPPPPLKQQQQLIQSARSEVPAPPSTIPPVLSALNDPMQLAALRDLARRSDRATLRARLQELGLTTIGQRMQAQQFLLAGVD
jgi:hypothetical protein